MHAKSLRNNTENHLRLAHAMLLLVVAVILFSIPFSVDAQTACTGTCDGNGICSNATGACAAPVNAPNDPTAVSLSNDGILGCLGQGARVASNPGTTRAVGGVYVPVNDAAVTLNTGFLVYKECILDGMSRRIAESGTAEMGRQALASFNTGRGGGTQYLQNFDSFKQPYNVQITVNTAQDIQNSQMCAAFRDRIANVVARNFVSSGNTNATMACSFASDADRTAMVNGTAPINFGPQWIGLISGDYAIYRANQAIALNQTRMARFDENSRQMIMMGQGVIPVFDNNTNPLAMNIVTPGFIIANAISQIAGSGYRQLENANEVDQIVANLWGGLTTRLLSSATGVPGLFVSTGNQPAYINQMVAQTQAAVRAGVVNAAVLALTNYRSAEAAYLEAKQGIRNALSGAISQLQSIETQCWDLIIPKVQEMATAQGATLQIPPSTDLSRTQFSRIVIDSPQYNIRPLASTTDAEITASQQTIQAIDALITQATNTSSPAAQQQAVLQADAMSTSGRIHTMEQAQAAASQRDSITSTLSALITSPQSQIKVEWGDSTDPNIGWCNVNNTPTIERWFNAWKI